jgi:putative transposase
VRSGGKEAALPSVLAFRETDPLTTRVMDQLLLVVSTRAYAASLEVVPADTRSPATSKSAVSRRLVAADAHAARRHLQALASCLETNSHPDAAASLREGLEETLTVLKLELPSTLRRFFATTNGIENIIATLRHVTRNVKCWRGGDMARRWAGLGLLPAAACVRRIKHHRELPHDAAAEVAA